MHQAISLRELLAQASQLRDGKDCAFALESDIKPFSGSQSLIFVVKYTDGMEYGFRPLYHARKYTIRDSLSSNELGAWNAFTNSQICLVPKIVASNLSDDNLIGFPFIADEWLEGEPLTWNDDELCDSTHRDKIIKNLARSTIETACRLQKPGEDRTLS